MSDLKYYSRQEPAQRLPWIGLGEQPEFDLFAPTCAVLEADAVQPLGAYLAKLSTLPISLVSRFLATPDTAAIAVLCRSLGLTKSAFEALTLCCTPTSGEFSLAPASALFDALSRPRAERIVDHWRQCEPNDDEPAHFPVLGSRPDT